MTSMTSYGYHSYKDRDRIQVLEKQVADLKLLTGQQSLTIGRLEEESSRKSDRISQLLGVESRPGRLTTTRQVRSASAATFRPRSSLQSALDTNNIKNNKIEQLSAEVEYWKRHFNLAEQKISKLEKENSRLNSERLPSHSNLKKSPNDSESIFLKKLLEENSDLKQRLESWNKSLKGTVTAGEDQGDSGKENEPEVGEEGRQQSNPKVTLKSKAQQNNVLRPSRPNSVRQRSSQLPSQRNTRSNEREKGVVGVERRHTQSRSLGRTVSQPSLANTASGSCHQPEQSQVLQQQVNHLSQQNNCLHHQVCQLRAELERAASSYSCSCEKSARKAGQEQLCSKLQCLQRQVCHLKHQLVLRTEQAGPQWSGQEVAQIRGKLNQAELEIEKLVTKCDSLLEQKKSNLEKISQLQRKVDSMMSSPNVDSRVKGLITNIESQRDNYKHQVEKLIKDLQSKDKVIIVEKERANEEPDGRGQKRTLVSKPRGATEVLPESLPRPQEDLSVSLELLEVRLQLAEKGTLLDQAREEIVKLRGELASLQSQLNLYNVKETQTSPSLERRKQNLEDSVNEMKKLIVNLEKENSRLKKSNIELENQNSLTEREVDVVDTGIRETRTVQDLQEKVRFLESQLGKTEDNLRNCQNLMSDGSKRTLELNSQMMKLRQEETTARKTADELRLKIDKKDELIRRIIEDKDNLLMELNESRDKMQELKSQVYQKTELLSNIDRSKDSLESQLSDLQMTVKQLERNLREKDRRVEELKETRVSLEAEARNTKGDNGRLRTELEQQKNEVERLSDESRGKSEELVDIRSELQRYITEVKRVEELLDLKESDRIGLLTQYEELSKEVSAYETTNRSLEMQAANLMLEVRSREDDLAAAKLRCDGLENYVQEILSQNEEFRLQVSNLTSKVDILTSDLKSNRVTRDSVITDLENVNELAVRLNSEKVELVNRISTQNQQVEGLQDELIKLREELLGAMAQLEDEKHRASTLQRMVTNTTREEREERQTVITRTLQDSTKDQRK